jgi:hypothetical protein
VAWLIVGDTTDKTKKKGKDQLELGDLVDWYDTFWLK